ncbi:MAG: hypothetical protein OEV37_00695 [Candidatus Berkelbacteria bacterium]|nr:hypothetical protein [Candidatus Berkelbacteria bacterium]
MNELTVTELLEECPTADELIRRIELLSTESPKEFAALIGGSFLSDFARGVASHLVSATSTSDDEGRGRQKVAALQVLSFANSNSHNLEAAISHYCELQDLEEAPPFLLLVEQALRPAATIWAEQSQAKPGRPRSEARTATQAPQAAPAKAAKTSTAAEEHRELQAEEPSEARWHAITAFLPGPYFDHEVEGIERDIRQLHAWTKQFPPGSYPVGELSAEKATGRRAGVKVRFPAIVISGSTERFFWWPPKVQEFAGFEALQVETAERWFGQRVARVVCCPEGKRLYPYAPGDQYDPTRSTQALFTVRSLIPFGGTPQDEQGDVILQLGYVSVDVILQLGNEGTRLSPPHFLIQQHHIAQAEEDLLVLRTKIIRMDRFTKDEKTGRLSLPRMPHEMRIFRPAIEAALAKSRHPEDRETAFCCCEKDERRRTRRRTRRRSK